MEYYKSMVGIVYMGVIERSLLLSYKLSSQIHRISPASHNLNDGGDFMVGPRYSCGEGTGSWICCCCSKESFSSSSSMNVQGDIWPGSINVFSGGEKHF